MFEFIERKLGTQITLPKFSVDNKFPTRLRTQGMNWNNLCCGLESKYDVIELTTSIGNTFRVLKMVKNSTIITILENGTNTVVKDHGIDLNQIKIDSSTNCFGFCFSDGKYLIEYPQTIINDYLTEVFNLNEADFAILEIVYDFDSFGKPLFQPIHAVKINKDSQSISYKNGHHSIVENDDISNINGTYNFNRFSYYKIRN